MKPFKTVDSNDLAFFESVMPGRVFAGEIFPRTTTTMK